MLSQLCAEDFYDLRHKKIFRTASRMCSEGKVLDSATLSTELRQDGEDALSQYCLELPEKTPSAANFPYYLELIQALTTRRQVIIDTSHLKDLAEKPNTSRSALLSAARKLGDAFTSALSAGDGLSLHNLGDFQKMTFNNDDILLGDRLWAKGQSLVLAGSSGVGKSRLVFQLAACMITGRPFLCFPTGGRNLRWLVLQTENSNRRLQTEAIKLQGWLGNDFEKVNQQLIVHSIEKDFDACLNLDDDKNAGRISQCISDTRPDIIVIDPLVDFSIGDLNKDVDMRETLQSLSKICRRNNPERAILVVHHSLTGRAGAAKATGFERSSFARNSKALHGWTRGQINLAPVDAGNNDRLIIACGKCSNGREFEPFGVVLDPDTMTYSEDESIDVSEWEDTVNDRKPNAPLMNSSEVADLCTSPMTAQSLGKLIQKRCGCPRQNTYRYIKRAEKQGFLQYNKISETYSLREHENRDSTRNGD